MPSSPLSRGRFSGNSRRLRRAFESLEARWLLAADLLDADDAVDVPALAARADVPALEARRDASPRRPLARPFEPHLRVDVPRTRAVRQLAAIRAAAAIEAAMPVPAPANAPTAPVGDLSGDFKVDRADVALLASNFGRTDAAFADGDLNGDSIVDLADLAAIRLGPGAFDITAPLGTSADDTPDLAWTSSPGAVRYDATIESAPGCSGASVVASALGITETQATFAALADGPYYACVRAYDEYGNATDAANNAAAFTISTAPPGSIAIDLAANRASVASAGTVVTYTYTIRNTGDVALANVALVDSLALAAARQADLAGDNDEELEAGEIWRYTANYTVTQADLDSGLDLINIATADSDQSPAATDDAVVFNLFELSEITVGSVNVIPIDHASFVMLWNGATIYVDPVGGGGLYTGLPKADLLLVTHSHSDHYSASTITAVSDAETQFITSQAVYNLSSYATFRARTTILGYGQTTAVLGLSVEAVHAYNGNHPSGTGNGYVASIDGLRVYISGDTGAVPEIRALEDIDVAFLCMNVPFTMTVDEAASVTRDMQPAIVIPYHYRNQGGTFADLARFKSLVGRDLPIEVRLLDWY
ncbi:MAG: hypothetical protein DCC68_19635 [Planctomycetota bacterium]|nr:MAG: hypothetical protein DCC68_19635 [Planctomycetota bacterium]